MVMQNRRADKQEGLNTLHYPATVVEAAGKYKHLVQKDTTNVMNQVAQNAVLRKTVSKFRQIKYI
jgi:hypothetical protein